MNELEKLLRILEAKIVLQNMLQLSVSETSIFGNLKLNDTKNF